MKIAITGKGGVGKTTLSAGLATLFAAAGTQVVAVDADPDSNLAATLGFPDPEGIAPISEMKDLIAERTGAQPGISGSYFALNPRVDDIPESFCPQVGSIRLLVMGGASRAGGSGCLCPESAFLRSLMAHLIFGRQDVVIMDMEAGVEHLTRGTARGVDVLLVVVEPGERSLETAQRIHRLGADLGLKTVWVVANKVRGEQDRQFILRGLTALEVVAFIPYRNEVMESGMGRGGIAAVLEGPAGEELRKLQARLEREVVGAMEQQL
ncbi:MAG: AAA family ATPase [Candidatus Latescibacteria bacterium]|nr:AAA family ATPase [Candidatus Latescibacterota bacterium]